MRSLSRTRRLLAPALIVSVLSAGSSRAGGVMVPCVDPFVFRGAKVNVVVLPFAASGPLATQRRTGAMLAYLIQQTTLHSILDLGSVGAVQLVTVSDAEVCTPDSVLERLQHPPSGSLQPGGGLVLVWGRIYEEAEQVFVQSFARYLVAGRDEGLAVEVGGARFFAPVTTQTVTFAPLRIERRDLDRIVEEYGRASTLRTAPDRAAPGQRMDEAGDLRPNGLAYRVVDARPGWVRIEGGTREKSVKGWLEVVPPGFGDRATRSLPELAYVEGLAAYLASNPVKAKTAFDRFGSAVRADASLPQAVATQLLGLLAWRAGDRTGAAGRFRAATELLPGDSRALGLQAVADSALGLSSDQPFSARRTAATFALAAALDPRSQTSADNLAAYAKVLSSPETSRRVDLSPDELKAFVTSAEAARREWRPVDDDQIRRNVMARKRELGATGVDVSVHGGVVKLSGEATKSQRDQLGRATSGLSGVTSVDNVIRVKAGD